MLKIRFHLPLLLIAGLAAFTAPAFARSAVTTGQISLLSGPDAGYSALSSLAEGARVDLVWCGLRDDWCLVDRLGRRGWVPLAKLKLKSPGGKAAVNLTGGEDQGTKSSNDAARSAVNDNGRGGASDKGGEYAVHESPPGGGDDHPVISKGPVYSAQP